MAKGWLGMAALAMAAACWLLAAWTPPAAAADAPVWVIAAPPAAAMGRDELAQVYRRQKAWLNGQRLQPVNLPAQHPLRRWFSQQVLAQSPEELDAFWREQYFNGVVPPYVFASEEAVIRFVLATPGAVGYVSSCSGDRRARVILVLEGGPPCGR